VSRPLIRLALTLGVAAAVPSVSHAGDAGAGERVFSQCRACHQVGPGARNLVGPVLNGLFGRPAGSVPGYSYSDANRRSGITWDEASFRDYIRDPRAAVPGTKMIFAGLKDGAKVDDLVAYLRTFEAVPLPR
jgi:cytochrome c